MKVSKSALLFAVMGAWSFGFLMAYSLVHFSYKVGPNISWLSPVVIGSFNLALAGWIILDENKTPKTESR